MRGIEAQNEQRHRRESGHRTSRPEFAVPQPRDGRRSRLVIVLFQGDEQLHRKSFWTLRDKLLQQVSLPRQETEIDLWLDSQGGSANAAYKIALRLRHHANLIRVVVPDSARSAATLLALCGDELYIGPDADHGPLDAQIDTAAEGTRLAALDIMNTLPRLEDRASCYAMHMADEIHGQMLLSQAQSQELANDLAGRLYAPLTAKVSPEEMLYAEKYLNLAFWYGERLLAMRNNDHVTSQGFAAAKDVELRRMLTGYGVHDCIIDYDEACDLGLPVMPLDRYERADDALGFLQYLQKRGESLIEVYANSSAQLHPESPSTSSESPEDHGAPHWSSSKAASLDEAAADPEHTSVDDDAPPSDTIATSQSGRSGPANPMNSPTTPAHPSADRRGAHLANSRRSRPTRSDNRIDDWITEDQIACGPADLNLVDLRSIHGRRRAL